MSEFLWVEKYRPKKISECILTEELKNTFTQFLKQKEIPNLLLSGSAGTGKTTVARALCEELHCDYIIINGSDEGRQIDTVRSKINRRGGLYERRISATCVKKFYRNIL